MPRAFTQHEKELIGARLLEQGARQFAAHGLRKTNVEELAQAAGISKGAFYLFYESKEALFMDVIEEAEQLFRREMLAAVDQPGPTPRARLVAVFKKAFSLFERTPLLQFFSGRDYDVLFSRIPPEKLQQHLANDLEFIETLVARGRAAGIPIQVRAEQVSGLLYAFILTFLHQDDFGPNAFAGTLDLLLELIAAYCLGEVEVPNEAGH